MSGIIIRSATQADLPWLLTQLDDFAMFFGSARSLCPTPEHAQSVLGELIAEHPFFVAEGDKGRVGFIAGMLSPHPLNPTITVLQECLWWVMPGTARRARAGALLLRAFEACGQARAHWTIVTLQARSPIGARLLQRRGFRAQETSYLREVA